MACARLASTIRATLLGVLCLKAGEPEKADGLAALRAKALQRVIEECQTIEEYQTIADLSRIDLDRINRPRPPQMRYPSVEEHVRELSARAGAVADFAVARELITPAQALQVILDFQEGNPDVWGDLPPEPPS